MNVIGSGYDDYSLSWKVSKELIKESYKGYKNVKVVRVKTDTKGLRMYVVYGEV